MLTLEPCGSPDQAARRPCWRPCGGWPTAVGGNVGRLSTRGTLVDGELRSAQAPTACPPVWFVFTGGALRPCSCGAEQACWLLMGA